MRIIILSITTLWGLLSFTYPDLSTDKSTEIENNLRTEIISELVKIEEDIAKARCFCRIGDDRGASLKEYPNPLKDLGTLRTYNGIKPVNNKNEDDCGRLCAKAAEKWFSSISTDRLCAMRKKSGSTQLLAYSKVGGRKWRVRGAGKIINCCLTSGITVCPSGWNSENTNFPGLCSKAVCPPLITGDRRLYSKNGSIWGFIWKNMIYQLRKGNYSPGSWKSC